MKELGIILGLYILSWFLTLSLPNSYAGYLGFSLKVEILIFYLPLLFIGYLIAKVWRGK